MHRRLAFVIVLTLNLVPSLTAQEGAKPTSTEEQFATLDAAGDRAGIIALFREHPEQVIPVLDRDLEGSLALWEKEGEAKRDEIDKLIARALRGADAAVEATGRRRVLDYVTSFAGWSDGEKKRFRSGQAAFGASRGHLRAEELEMALEKGRECRELAEPLGDWWGTAMGLQAEAAALRSLGLKEEAVTAFARSRLIYRELGLTGSALRLEAELAELCLELGRKPRAKALITDGLRTAEALGDERSLTRFRGLEKLLKE